MVGIARKPTTINYSSIDARKYGITPNLGTDQTALFTSALADIPANSELLLEAGTYIANITYGKDRVAVRGAGKPVWGGGAFGNNTTVLTGGTIIIPPPATAAKSQVNFVGHSHCGLYDLGIDQSTGPDTLLNGVVSALGTPRNTRVENIAIVGRGYATHDSQHAILFNRGSRYFIKNIDIYRFGHGVAIKVPRCSVEGIYAYDQELTAVIVKSDANDSNTNVYDVTVSDVFAECSGNVPLASAAIMLESAVNHHWTKDIKVNGFYSIGHLSTSFAPLYVNAPATTTSAYSQTGTDVTVTWNGHPFSNGDIIFVEVATGSLRTRQYVVSNVDTNTFHITAADSATTSGNLSINTTLDIKISNVEIENAANDRGFYASYGKNITVSNATVVNQAGYGYWNAFATKVNLINCFCFGHSDTTGVTTGTFDIAHINGRNCAPVRATGGKPGLMAAAAIGEFGDPGVAYMRLYQYSGIKNLFYSWGFTTSGNDVLLQRSTGAAAIGSESPNVTAMKIAADGLITPVKLASAPTWSSDIIGSIYFDTTLNKLRIAGASAWETVTSS